MRVNQYAILLCLLLGNLINVFVIIKLNVGLKLIDYFQNVQRPNNHQEVLKSEADYFNEVVEKEKVYSLTPINSEKTLQTKLVAFSTAGLGNKLFEIISLLGIANTLKRTPVIDARNSGFMKALADKIQTIYPDLAEQFELRIIPSSNVTTHKMKWRACCKFDDPLPLLDRPEKHLKLDGNYFQSFKYFDHLRPQVLKWLIPDVNTLKNASDFLPSELVHDFLICVHIRRGDFQFDGMHEPSNATFTRAATDFLVEKYQKTHRRVSVVVLGNDVNFAYTVFQDRSDNLEPPAIFDPDAYNYTIPESSPEYKAVLTPTLSPDIDLAFSRMYCDVTLITSPSSTFGWWLSYLSKPESVSYYRDIRETKDKVILEMNPNDFFPPDWKMLGTNPDGSIKQF